MKKSVLLIESANDTYLINGLNKMGCSVFAIMEKQPLEDRMVDDSGLSKPPEIKTLPAQYALRRDILSWTKYYMGEVKKLIKEKNISLIVPCSQIYGHLYLILGFLNQKQGLAGMDYNSARFWYRKSRYLKYFRERGFKTPKIFQKVLFWDEIDLSLLEFPVVCKPDCGVGGYGVFLAQGPADLKQLFRPASKNEKSSRYTGDFYRKRFSNGEISNCLYNEMYSRYLITEFVPGPVVSVAGIKTVRGIELSLIFEIEPSRPPFRTETAYLAPFSFKSEEVVGKTRSVVKKAVQQPVFPNGPFMFDFILNPDGELYLLEADPRISMPSAMLMDYCYGDKLYIERAVCAVLGQKTEIKERGPASKYIYSKDLPLPEGVLLRFSQKKPFSPAVIAFDFGSW